MMKKGFQFNQNTTNSFWGGASLANNNENEGSNMNMSKKTLPDELSMKAEQSMFSKTLKTRLYSNRDEKLSIGCENITFSKVSNVQKPKDINNDLFPAQKKVKPNELDFLNKTDETMQLVNIRSSTPLNRIQQNDDKAEKVDKNLIKLKPIGIQSPRVEIDNNLINSGRKNPMWFIGKFLLCMFVQYLAKSNLIKIESRKIRQVWSMSILCHFKRIPPNLIIHTNYKLCPIHL